jgi:hypothetical protein
MAGPLLALVPQLAGLAMSLYEQGKIKPPGAEPQQPQVGVPMENTTNAFMSNQATPNRNPGGGFGLNMAQELNRPPALPPSPLTPAGPTGGYQPVTETFDPSVPDPGTGNATINPTGGNNAMTGLGYAQMAMGGGMMANELLNPQVDAPGSGGFAGRPFQMNPSMRLGDFMRRRY